MKSSRKGRLRLCMEFPNDIYYKLQKGSIDAYTTMSNYIIRALIEKFEREAVVLDDADRKLFAEVMEKRKVKKVEAKPLLDKSVNNTKLKA
jgi:hypothetical protein